jgi:hypothetical protein
MNLAVIARGTVAACTISITVGCASIVSDSKYPVSITSTPSGANFEIENQAGKVVETGVTPGHVTLEAGAGYFDGEKYIVTYSKPGYTATKAILDTEVDNWYIWGNLGFGGLPGYFILDPLTGAMYKLPPLSHTTMYPAQTPVAQIANGMESKKTKDQLVAELQTEKLSYTEYMQRLREINSQP